MQMLSYMNEMKKPAAAGWEMFSHLKSVKVPES